MVDVGDITFVKDGLAPKPTFLELKEGSVNETIVALLSLDGSELEEGLHKLEQSHGTALSGRSTQETKRLSFSLMRKGLIQ